MKLFLKRLVQLVGILVMVLILAIVALHWYQPKLHPVMLPEPKPVSGAAVFYNKAFAAMPEMTEGEKEVVSAKEPDEVSAKVVLKKWDDCLGYIAQGAALPRCEWGLDYTQGPGMNSTVLNKPMLLCRVLGMRARLHFLNGEVPAATDDLLLILRFSRHVGQAPVLITKLIEISIDMMAINLAARRLQEFDHASLQWLSESVATLPASPSLKEVFRNETALFSAWFNNMFMNQLLDATKTQRAAPSPSQGGKNVFQFERRNQEFKITGGFPAKYLAFSLSKYEQNCCEMGRLMDLPYAQARPQIDAFKNDLQRYRWITGPFSILVLPAMSGARLKEVQMEAVWRIFQTALKAQLHDPSSVRGALAKMRDPFDDQPIEMRDVEGGVEIQLKSGEGKKPVTLMVGLPAK